MNRLLVLVIGLSAAGALSAKLPPPSDEAKAKADEAKAKAAWGDKVAAYKLCLSQDKVAAAYLKAKGKDAAKPVPMPACADPGPYAPPAAAPATAAAAAPAPKK